MTAEIGRMGGRISSSRLLLLVIVSTLCGCATAPPPRPFADEEIRDSGGVAYLWSAGKATQPYFSMTDYAVVIGIDNQALPPEYRPSAGYEPFGAWRMEVPVGRHVVQILDKEMTFAFIPVYLSRPLVMEHETRLVEFTAEAGRAYLPLAADKCGRKWIWIADEGPVVPEDPSNRMLVFSAGLPTVGGESPPDESC